MKISNIKFELAEKENSKLLAYASFVLNDLFEIRSIRIVKGERKIYIAMPSFKKNNEWINIIMPIDKEAEKELSRVILDAWSDYEKNRNS